MGLPSIFIRAGYLPSIACIIYVCVSSSLCGTLLAETIRSIPGNNRFTKNIEFSMAFHHFLGDHWYLVAESLFCLSCLSQALASIVVTSHTLDGFLASFLFRQTYALQILPHLELISWSADSCHSNSNESTSLYNIFLRRQLSSPSLSSEGGGSGECTPFAGDGPLIVSLGFLLVTACFLPLGTGSLKEAMLVQLLSFLGLLLLISQFCVQFYIQGLNYAVPMIGTSNLIILTSLP